MRGKSGTLARAPAQLPEETGSWSELWALHPATPRGPAPARLCAGFWGWPVSPTCLHREFFSALSPAVTLGLEVHRAWVNTPSSRLVFCPPCSPALVNNQQQKELHDSVKLKHFLVSKCRAAKVGNAARAGTLRRGTAWLARHRGFPSLQPRRVPVCGTRRAPAAPGEPQPAVLHQLQRRHWWRVEERVHFHQYQLLPARSKEQCPALWADQPRGIQWVTRSPNPVSQGRWGLLCSC